jgi:outer membrane protein assembly factor BamB
MSALGRKVLDLAEQQGLLDGKAIAELRKQVAESKFVITPEAIAKVLVDHGHLTPFQARKLVSQALGDEPDPVEQRVAEKPKPKPPPRPVEDLTFADAIPDVKAVRPVEPAPKPTEQPLARQPAPRELEAKTPETSKSVPQKLTGAPGQIIVNKSEAKPVAPLQPPVEGSTADDFVELKSLDPAPHTRGNRWKTDSGAELNETVELTPIDLNEPALTPLPPVDLVPIDDLFAGESVPIEPAAPAPAGRPPAAKTPASKGSSARPSKPIPSTTDLLKPIAPLTPLTPLKPVARATKSVWDSPLMLIGGGSLGIILVLFALLFYALTRGSAAELFSKGEEEYRAGNYGNAIAIYEKFLKQYPEDPSASLARVRRGMANLRQVTDTGKNPRVGLEMAKQVLPTIETEEKFAEARSELATILPDIAEGFATQAAQTEDPARKSELVKLAGDSLALVNNPAYLPASLRKDREGRISRIVDKLKSAERGIQEEKDLLSTVEGIAKLTEKGEAAAAYELQDTLLRTYPGLATNPQLVAAIRQVGEKERELVKATSGGPAPFKTDHPATSERVILSYRDGAAAAGAAGEPVFLLLEGGIYGVDAASGRVLWRRFVGYETTNLPLSVGAGAKADAVFIDGQRHELVRIKGSTGELIWRQKLSGDALGPVVAGNRILLTTHRGLVMAIEAATGEIAASAQLPQGAVVAPAVRQAKIYQLGEHSTLFVLEANSLACQETVYLGHEAGELFVPPVAVLDQVLIVTSPADDYSQIQVLSPDAKTKKLAPFGKPQRLKGRIIAPLVTSAARAAAMTDMGQVTVYDVDPAGAQEHIRLVAGLDASEPTPRHGYCELDRNRLWVSGHRNTMFEIQSSLSQLSRKWTENHDDAFVAPPKLQGEMLVTARRRSGMPAVIVEGVRAATGGETVWTTHVAAPISAMVATENNAAVTALTAECRLYAIGGDAFKTGQASETFFSPDVKNASVLDQPFLSGDGQTLVWTEAQGGGRIFSYHVGTGGKPTSVTPPAKVAAGAIAALGGIVAPLTNGSVALLGSSSDASATPFLPPLVPEALPQWTRPAALADGAGFVISDGRGAVYAVTKRDQPKPQLIAAGESTVLNPIVSPLVLAGSTVVGVMRQESTDALAGFDSRGKSVFEPVPLEGRVEGGPFVVGGIVLVAAEPDGLVCIGGDGRVRWQQPPENGFLAGSPLALPEGDLLVAYQSGVVCRLDAATGKELSRREIGEPLAGPALIWKSQAYLSGSDGIVHRISIPPRP